MPSDLVFKSANAVHQAIIKVSGGRFGWSVANMPALELTTTGRKSGRPRTVIVTSPHQEGDTIAIVASKGGDENHPAWYHNLLDTPEVEVSWKGEPAKPMTARVAEGEERDRLWATITDQFDNYAGYQRKTDREIPVVLLDPI